MIGPLIDISKLLWSVKKKEKKKKKKKKKPLSSHNNYLATI